MKGSAMRKPKLLSQYQAHHLSPSRLGFTRRAFLNRLMTIRRKRHQPSTDEEHISRLNASVEEKDKELAKAYTTIHELEHAHDDRNAEAESLRKVGEAVGALFDIEEMLRVVAGIAVQVTATESSQVYLFNETRDELVLRAVDDAGVAQQMVGTIRAKNRRRPRGLGCSTQRGSCRRSRGLQRPAVQTVS